MGNGAEDFKIGESMKSMQFKVEPVRKFLEENGFVFTCRGYLMEDKFVEVEGIGKCWRKKIDEIFKITDLIRYCQLSGFDGIGDININRKWWQTIEKFCKGKPKYLYLVVKVE